MQFQVPQFIDVEDKIIGPFTIKQFLYLAGGLGMAYLSYRFIPWIGIILGLCIAGFGGALAFYKFNNKPSIFLMESAFHYILSSRFYVWRRKEKQAETVLNLNNFKPVRHETGLAMKTVSSKLSDLAWSIEVQSENDREQKRMDELGI
mgnify:CR=1 FL=1